MLPPLCDVKSHDTTQWSSLVPPAVVALFFLQHIVSKVTPRSIRSVFTTFLTLEEARALLTDSSHTNEHPNPQNTSRSARWRPLTLAFISLAETLVWLSYGTYLLVNNDCGITGGIEAILLSFTWLYSTLRAIYSTTAPVDIAALLLAHLAQGILGTVQSVRENAPWDHIPYMVVTWVTHTALIVGLLGLILGMPLATPDSDVDVKQIGVTETPEDYTTLWQWITFSWVWPLVKLGRYTTLNETDVWNLSVTMQSKALFKKFMNTPRATLLRQILVCNSLDLLVDLLLTIACVFFNYAGPFFLQRILSAIETGNNYSQAYTYAFLAFLCTITKAQLEMQHLWFGRRAATRIRSELMAAIYNKALKRRDLSGVVNKEKPLVGSKDKRSRGKKVADSNEPKPGADVGKIVNLMAGDANRISNFFAGIYFLYGPPIEIVIASMYLYQLLGIAAFSGIFVLLVCWPLNTAITKRSIRIQKGTLAARDKRMGVLNELIGAVKFIKYFAWESKWINRVLDAREVEMKWMVKSRINQIVFFLLWQSVPVLISISSFLTYVLRGQELTVSIAFTSIALFGMIRGPLNIIPAWAVQGLQTKVALDRIATFLSEEEIPETMSSLKADLVPRSHTYEENIGIERCSFIWNTVKQDETEIPQSHPGPGSSSASTTSDDSQSENAFELKDISVVFPNCALTIVTGPTASGKTALLMALLGEMTVLPGSGRIILSKNPTKVDKYGNALAVSYAGQTPWLRHQSIRDNILFGTPFDADKYDAVVEACALKPDLEMLEDGDSTEIGAKGVSLSGGQKARVALARAIYAPTKFVLLDDPLSAVDSHTARFLVEHLLSGPLLANRTVILVTHHVELVLPSAQYLVRMLDGRIDTQGPIETLRERGLLEGISYDAPSPVTPPPETEEANASHVLAPAQSEAQALTKKPRKLVKDEHREVGGVKWVIYKTYLRASSYYIWAFLALMVVINQFLGVGEKFWVKIWGEAYPNPTNSTSVFSFHSISSTSRHHPLILQPHGYEGFTPLVSQKSVGGIEWPNADAHPLFYVGIYAAIGFSGVFATLISAAAQYTGALKASRSLFYDLLTSVIGATMRWHDVTPQGRMLNRFGKDIESIDTTLAGSLQAVNSSIATVVASLITVSIFFPWFIIPAFALGFIYRELSLGYLNAGRDLRRMESNSKSPIFSDFSEVVEGIVTVRAFSAERRFLDGLHTKIDLTTKMWHMFWMMNRWLLFNFDILGATTILTTTLFALSGLVSAGTAGICITSTMGITLSTYWACRFWTALEMDLNSVERVVEYLDIPQEPKNETQNPPAYWPSSSNGNGLIVMEDLVVKYAPELPPVLHGVSLQLNAGERIGLLGRTGSGKSTLATSILRFVEPASGRIIIDGIDISTIGLHDLRSRITFIPQDAALFSGTLRSNIDPFDEHDDSECLDALQRAHVITDSKPASQRVSRASSMHEDIDRESTTGSSTTELDDKTKLRLDTQISAGGHSLSQGQRQLVSMARALLRKSPIIILDEATSSIDFATDAKIQATIREEFKGSLLITVAHRLRTVIDYDRLIILDKGQVADFDTPYKLIQKEGIFRSMCLKSGTFAELEMAAKEKAERDGQL